MRCLGRRCNQPHGDSYPIQSDHQGQTKVNRTLDLHEELLELFSKRGYYQEFLWMVRALRVDKRTDSQQQQSKEDNRIIQ